MTLTGCGQTVIAPSVNAPSECANLIGEYARRSFAYNAKGRAFREERVRTGRLCPQPSRLREQIAELSPIIAVMEKMDAKGCYQQPVGPISRKVLDQLKAQLAYCEAQAATK
jgi:hypothetical protein